MLSWKSFRLQFSFLFWCNAVVSCDQCTAANKWETFHAIFLLWCLFLLYMFVICFLGRIEVVVFLVKASAGREILPDVIDTWSFIIPCDSLEYLLRLSKHKDTSNVLFVEVSKWYIFSLVFSETFLITSLRRSLISCNIFVSSLVKGCVGKVPIPSESPMILI